MAKKRDSKGGKGADAAAEPAVEPGAADPTGPTPAADKAQPGKTPGGSVAVFAALAVLLLVAAVGYLTRPQWAPLLARKAPPATVAETKKPVAATPPAPVETQTPAAEKPAPEKPAATAAAPPPADDVSIEQLKKERDQLRADLDKVMARLETVERSVETARKMIEATTAPAEKLKGGPALPQLTEKLAHLDKTDASLKELEARVGRMEKDATGAARAVVLAVAGLKDAIARGEPFEKPLEGLVAIAKDDPNVKAAAALLGRYAKAGVPTPAALRERFAAIAGRIVQASRASDDTGWLARAAARVAGLVTWRRVGPGAKPDSVDALVARAESLLKAGDLAGAVKALDGLSGHDKAAAVAQPWLTDAKARVGAERAAASLYLHALAQLTSPAKP